MTSQFLRFYFCVLGILALAWGIQYYNAQQTNDDNTQVVRNVYLGPMRLVKYIIATSNNRREDLARLNAAFEFPVGFLPPDQVNPEDVREELVFHQDVSGLYLISALDNQEGYVVFGPLPELVSPSQSAQLAGLAVLLVLAAIAIALLLRPLVNQIRLVEKTAQAIAAGDLNARIDEQKAGSAVRMARSFNIMADKTTKLIESQKQLLQCVSHELKTPISKIRFAMDLLRNTADDTQREKRLDSLEVATTEMETLITELLGFVKLDSLEPVLHTEDCNLKDICQRQFDFHQSLFPDIRFEMGDGFQGSEPMVRGDRVMLERVFANLIGNAARFARSRVQVLSVIDDGRLRIHVDDDGCGIDPGDRERVFEPFTRINEDRSGYGLGLTIVRKILENHGARIELETSELGGTSVRIGWPNDGFMQAARQA